jgi:hypothetical protein
MEGSEMMVIGISEWTRDSGRQNKTNRSEKWTALRSVGNVLVEEFADARMTKDQKDKTCGTDNPYGQQPCSI